MSALVGAAETGGIGAAGVTVSGVIGKPMRVNSVKATSDRELSPSHRTSILLALSTACTVPTVFDLAFFTVCITDTWPMLSESAEALADTCTGVGRLTVLSSFLMKGDLRRAAASRLASLRSSASVADSSVAMPVDLGADSGDAACDIDTASVDVRP